MHFLLTNISLPDTQKNRLKKKQVTIMLKGQINELLEQFVKIKQK